MGDEVFKVYGDCLDAKQRAMGIVGAMRVGGASWFMTLAQFETVYERLGRFLASIRGPAPEQSELERLVLEKGGEYRSVHEAPEKAPKPVAPEVTPDPKLRKALDDRIEIDRILGGIGIDTSKPLVEQVQAVVGDRERLLEYGRERLADYDAARKELAYAKQCLEANRRDGPSVDNVLEGDLRDGEKVPIQVNENPSAVWGNEGELYKGRGDAFFDEADPKHKQAFESIGRTYQAIYKQAKAGGPVVEEEGE